MQRLALITFLLTSADVTAGSRRNNISPSSSPPVPVDRISQPYPYAWGLDRMRFDDTTASEITSGNEVRDVKHVKKGR
jgi:hypothetical protein